MEKGLKKDNKTNVARIFVAQVDGQMTDIKGLIQKDRYSDKQIFGQSDNLKIQKSENPTYICHCEDITEEQL